MRSFTTVQTIPPALLLLLAVLVSLPTVNTLSNSSPPTLLPSTLISFPPLLQKRQTCSDTTTSRCPSPASRFCCPTSSECIPLNNATSVICCPSGEDCSFIQPISCTNPDSDSDSDENPSQCGSNGQCCPVGYDCDSGSGGCKLKDENKPASYKLREECAKINSNGDNSGSGTTSETCTALIEATKKSCLQGCKQFPVKALLAGFFPGLAAGAIIMCVIGMIMRKREMRTMKGAIAAAAAGHGAGGSGVMAGDKSTTGGRSTSASEYKDGINISILNNAGGGFAAGRAGRRATTGGDGGNHGGGYSTSSNNSYNKQQRTRSSTGAATTLTSTEIAIGYDRKHDEQFSFVSGSGRGTSVSGSIVTSPTPPPPGSSTTQQQQQQTAIVSPPLSRAVSGIGSINSNSAGGVARGYDSDLRSPRHFIAEELAGSMPSIELDTTPPSSNNNNPPGNGTRGAAARRANSSTPTNPTMPPPPPRSRTTPSPIPPSTGSAIPLSTLTAKKPLPAPLTYEHLLQHQKHHSALATATTSSVHPNSATQGIIAPKAQSSYRSSTSVDDDASSLASTSLSPSDGDSSDDDGKHIKPSPGGPTNPHKKKKKKSRTKHHPHSQDANDVDDHSHLASPQPRHRLGGRLHRPGPPSDVTSCITDGDQFHISHDVDSDIMSTYPLPPLPLTGQHFSPSHDPSMQYSHHSHHHEQFSPQAAGGLTSLTTYSDLTAAGVIGVKPPVPRVSQVATKGSSIVLGEGDEDEEGKGRYSGYGTGDSRYGGRGDREQEVVMDWRRGEPPPP